jgi:hypothetical protein
MTEDDDFMIPRRSDLSGPEAGTGSHPSEPTHGKRIDPRILEERRRRKERLAPHPETIDNKKDPWNYLDRRIGDAFPAFEDRMWTLCATARWVAERTRDAVDGLSIDKERLFEIVPEIHEALAAGEVPAWAQTPNDPVPRELPSETWAVYQLGIEERDGLLRIVPVRASASPDERVLIDLRLSRDDVLRRWPADQENTPSREVGTAVAYG